MASTYLTRTPSSNGSKTTNTISLWVKRGKLGATQRLFSQLNTGGSGNPDDYIAFDNVDKINFQFYGDGTNGVNNGYLVTNRKFRDTSAWYHIVAVQDTTNGTSGNRLRLYVNGVRETSFSTENYPSQNTQGGAINNTSYPLFIGQRGNNSAYFDGSISHVHFSDGYAYEPTVFGSTDSTTGEWKINTSPSFTPGTNGFTILKDGNTITDQSANSNNFSLGGGTLTKTEDCPSNVFATWNPLYRTSASNFLYGNTQSQSPNTGGFAGISTLGASSGKYYAEFKLQAGSATYEACIAVMVGSSISGNSLPSGYPEYTVGSYGIRQGNSSSGNSFWTTAAGGRTSGSQHGGFSIGDTIGIALDIDSNKVYFSKGGQWNYNGSWNSATPSTYLTLISTYGDGQYLFVSGDSSGGNNATWSANFGNGYQQTTAVSSAGTNASGNGIFEYDVPTGFTALSTKGLNS